MRKVLVPFDRSENALRALRHAVNLLRDLRSGEVHIVHVHESPLAYGRAVAYRPEAEIAAGLDQQSADLLKPAIDIALAGGVDHQVAILTGSPAEAILRYCEEAGCTEIIMGTRGAGVVTSLLLGSVATKVLHAAAVPVTLVK